MKSPEPDRYVQKMLHVPVKEASVYTDMKVRATSLKKSVWRYLADLHKRYSIEEANDDWN